MQKDRSSLILAIFLITVGVGWLLSSIGFIPSVDWVWTLGLAMIGVLAIVLSGFDKVSFVISSFFGLASILSVLRQLGALDPKVEVPILVIAAGAILLAARADAIPIPGWIQNERR